MGGAGRPANSAHDDDDDCDNGINGISHAPTEDDACVILKCRGHDNHSIGYTQPRTAI